MGLNLTSKKSDKNVTEQVNDKQVLNNDGGYVFKSSDLMRVERFLKLGVEGGTFYQTQADLLNQNSKVVLSMIKGGRGIEVLNLTKEVSSKGLARKNDYAIYTLALLLTAGNTEVKTLAVQSVNEICRTGTHIFTLAQYLKDLRGWGTIVKKTFKKWYLGKTESDLAYQVIKYQQRNKWSHKDLLRLNHIKAPNDIFGQIFAYIIKGEIPKSDVLNIIQGFELAKVVTTESDIISLIEKYHLSREMIPTHLLNKPSVIKAMLPFSGITAIVRSLASWTACGFIDEYKPENIIEIENVLTNKDVIKKSKIHPLQLLDAIATYSSGRGLKGNLTWKANHRIIHALEVAFELSFDNVEPTGKKIYVACDVSPSMTSDMNGSHLSCMLVEAMFVKLFIKTERNTIVKGFTSNIQNLNISPNMSLSQVEREFHNISWGGTDCSLPMIDTINNKIKDIDTFIIFTDNDTNGGKHPYLKLEEYRKFSGNPKVKMIVCAMTSSGFTIANPDDNYMYDIVGFSPDLPITLNHILNEK